MPRFVPLVVVLAFLLIAAAGANAAQRYVSPSGTGASCALATPCDIVTGVNNASSGDEVIIGTGTYDTSTELEVTNLMNNVSIHGDAAAPRPVINSSANRAVFINGNNGTVSDLKINHTGQSAGLAIFATAKADHVDVHSTGGRACSAGGFPAVLRNSLCVASSPGAAGFNQGLSGGTPVTELRNVTAIGTGEDSFGIAIEDSANTVFTVNARNVIAEGEASDVQATSSDAALAIVNLQSSSYDSRSTVGQGSSVIKPGTGDNITAVPVFTDTTDYRTDPSSPTVDVGTVDGLIQFTDLDREPRIQGPATDMGAYETQTADDQPPATTIAKGPKSTTRSTKTKIFFESSKTTSTFECSLDNSAFKLCTPPRKLKHLKVGRHTFRVRALDALGTPDPSPETTKWKVKKKRHH